MFEKFIKWFLIMMGIKEKAKEEEEITLEEIVVEAKYNYRDYV